MKKSTIRKPRNFKAIIVGRLIEYLAVLISVMILTLFIVLEATASISNRQNFFLTNRVMNKISQNYATVKYNSYLGEGSGVAVYDSLGNKVYDTHNKFSDESVIPETYVDTYELMPLINTDVTVSFFNDQNGKALYSIYFTRYQNDQEIESQYVIDENYNIVIASNDLKRTSLTETEFMYFEGYISDSVMVRRYSFVDKDGNTYNMLLFRDLVEGVSLYQELNMVIWGSLAAYIVFFILFTSLMVYLIDRTISRPIGSLKTALSTYSLGRKPDIETQNEIKYFSDVFASFDKMAEKLEESEKEKRSMLADISHDLKTPITVIQGYAKALNDGMISDEDKRRYTEAIEDKADNLNELINMFYDYSKLDHPDYAINLEKTDIITYFRDYLASKYDELELAGYALEVDIPEKHLYAMIDRQQLCRVFENLIVNSVRHNEKGTIIYAGVKDEDNLIRLTLGDNGKGIAAKYEQTIFTPFVVGNESRNEGGSGLGLAISKKVVELHGGTIKLIIPPVSPYKTEFEIVLPTVK